MEAKEKSSSPAATAKGTAPSNCKYYSSLPPIFQVSDPQTKDEMKRGRAYDEGNQGEAYNPDYLYGGENYHKALSDVVSYVLRGCAGDGLSALSDVVVKVTNALVAWVDLSEPPSNPDGGKDLRQGLSLAEAQEHRPRAGRRAGVRAGGRPHGLRQGDRGQADLGGRARYVRPRRGDLPRDWRRAD